MIRKLLLAGTVASMGFAVMSLALSASAMESASAAAPAKPDLAKAQTTASTVCAACHGPDGNSPLPVYPSIAGMPREYVAQQLAHFKADIRVSPIMQPIAAQLSPGEMVALGVFYGQQRAKSIPAADAALVQVGRPLYRGGDATLGIPACASCHAPNGAGIPKNFPRLAGQHGAYTLTQLQAFKSGQRGNDREGKDANGRIMGAIASKLSEEQMRALAEYTQGLR